MKTAREAAHATQIACWSDGENWPHSAACDRVTSAIEQRDHDEIVELDKLESANNRLTTERDAALADLATLRARLTAATDALWKLASECAGVRRCHGGLHRAALAAYERALAVPPGRREAPAPDTKGQP